MLVSAAHSCCSFSWFCRCVRRSWARKAWISDSKLPLSDRRRCSEDVSCRSPWGGQRGAAVRLKGYVAGEDRHTGSELLTLMLSPRAHLTLRPRTLVSLSGPALYRGCHHLRLDSRPISQE